MAKRKKKIEQSVELGEDFTNDLGWVDPKFLYEVIKHVGIYVYDVETTGLDPRRDRLDGIAFYVPEGTPRDFGELGYYDGSPIRAWFPFNPYSFMCHIRVGDIDALEAKVDGIGVDMDLIRATAKNEDGTPREDHELILVDLRPPMDQEATMEALRPIWEELVDVVGITHNGKFDSGFIYVCPGTVRPIRVRNIWGDSMLADFCSDERRKRYGLKIRVKQEFNHQMTPYADAIRGQSHSAFTPWTTAIGSIACTRGRSRSCKSKSLHHRLVRTCAGMLRSGSVVSWDDWRRSIGVSIPASPRSSWRWSSQAF